MTTLTINNFSEATKAIERLMDISSGFVMRPFYKDGAIEESDSITFTRLEANEWRLCDNDTEACIDSIADELLHLVEFYDKVIVTYSEFVCGLAFDVAFTKGPSKAIGSEVAHASVNQQVKLNGTMKGETTMKKTIIYLINTPSNKSMNSFVEKNADKFEFNWVEAPKATMHNCLWASYSWPEDIKTAIAKRIKFKSFHQQTIYRVMFLDLRSGEVHTFKSMDDIKAYDIIRKTQFANYSFDKLANNVQAETAQWLKLADQLTHGVINAVAWANARQNCLDKMNLYLTDVDFDSYNAGHLEPRMKANVHTFDSDYKFFDLQFSKGDVTQHEEERESEMYVITDLETLKNFCHVLTCRRYGIDFDDSLGNGGRVTRECQQSRVIGYTELAELINQSDDRDYYIELLQNGASIEDIAAFFDLEMDDTASLSYREF